MTTIRKAIQKEWQTIAGFQQLMAKETENIELDPLILEKGINAIFEHPERGCYFVAVIDNVIVGSLLITYEWSDWRNRTIYWIQSVFVDPAYRRRGIYKLLYKKIKEMAEADSQIGGIRLYVDKTNKIAQQTYAALGMNGEHYQVFEWMK
ncbi:MAG: GNAT family N-acetyltransferase [Ignavibacteria bacterium]|nr:GNAT family N-acetyltransferase [Ignavibacteria bacterium]